MLYHKIFKTISSTVFYLCFFNMAFAEVPLTQDTYEFNGVDITVAVKYFKAQVKTLNKPVTIYNWRDEYGTPVTSSLSRAQKSARAFWDWYGGKDGADLMYGTGLYGAVDPVATNDFGPSQNWTLLEMKLPIGFKMLDLTLSSVNNENAISSDLVLLSQKFQCPTFSNLGSLFENGGAKLNETCQELVQNIFQDILEIDGFAYPYIETHFKACEAGYQGGRAFVIMNDKWMNDELIHYYNKDTKDFKENRIVIQTLFFQTLIQANLVLSENALDTLADYLLNHESYQVHGTKTNCTADNCDITFLLCNPENKCDELPLGSVSRPGGPLITEKEAKQTARHTLLWSDLEGVPKSTTTSEWLLENKFACSGELPYQNDSTEKVK